MALRSTRAHSNAAVCAAEVAVYAQQFQYLAASGTFHVAFLTKVATVVLGVIAMVCLIVAVDALALRDHVWLRLMVNAGIVLVFVGVYIALQDRH